MRLHHLALRTADLPRLERFYVGVLGLNELRRSGERSVWLDAAGTVLMLERRDNGEPGVPEGTLELVAFAAAPADAAQLLSRLATAGIAIEARTPSTVYFRDPDGRRVGLSAYPEAL
jgi:catechol 2,3-dioxygenase-like lactoylglutathione lyase family enzyme